MTTDVITSAIMSAYRNSSPIKLKKGSRGVAFWTHDLFTRRAQVKETLQPK